MNGRASIEKESSKGETSKDNLHVVEQVWSFSNFLYSNEEGKEDTKLVNILEKLILNNKLGKHVEEVKKAKEAQKAQVAKKLERWGSTLRLKKSSKS